MLVAAAAVVVLVLGVTTTMLVSRQEDGSPGIGLVAAADSHSRGETRLSARPWGTSVNLDLSGLPTGQRFVVWVVAADGTRQQAATWASTPDGQAHVTGASAFDTGDVSEVRVTTSAGTLLLSAEI